MIKGPQSSIADPVLFGDTQKDLGQRVRAEPRSKENQSRTAVKAIKIFHLGLAQ